MIRDEVAEPGTMRAIDRASSQDPQDCIFSSLELNVQPAHGHTDMGAMRSEK
jgi:hypothetical protein